MLTKGFAGIMALSMVAASCPVQGLAVTGSEVAADGTYTSSKAYNVVNDEPEEWEWDDYDVTVSIVVKDGLFIDNQGVIISFVGKNRIILNDVVQLAVNGILCCLMISDHIIQELLIQMVCRKF